MTKPCIYSIILLLLLSFFYSCSNDSSNFKINDFQKIELIKFNKNKVKFSTSFTFLNENNYDIEILKSDFDIFINGIDVASHINNYGVIVKSNKLYKIPIIAEFNPYKVFKDFETGIVKIKSDIVAEVEISGTITTKQNDIKQNLKYSSIQKVLFTNNKNIKLNAKEEIISK